MEGIVPTLLPSPRQGTMVKGTAGPCIAYWLICICIFVCFCIVYLCLCVYVCLCICIFIYLCIYVFVRKEQWSKVQAAHASHIGINICSLPLRPSTGQLKKCCLMIYQDGQYQFWFGLTYHIQNEESL